MAKTIRKKETPATEQTQEQENTIAETKEKLAKTTKASVTSRHGIATTETLWQDITRLAEIKHEKVNKLICRVLQEEVDRNSDILEKYKDFLGKIGL